MHEPYLPEGCSEFYCNFDVNIKDDLLLLLKEHDLENHIVVDKAVRADGSVVPELFGLYLCPSFPDLRRDLIYFLARGAASARRSIEDAQPIANPRASTSIASSPMLFGNYPMELQHQFITELEYEDCMGSLFVDKALDEKGMPITGMFGLYLNSAADLKFIGPRISVIHRRVTDGRHMSPKNAAYRRKQNNSH